MTTDSRKPPSSLPQGAGLLCAGTAPEPSAPADVPVTPAAQELPSFDEVVFGPLVEETGRTPEGSGAGGKGRGRRTWRRRLASALVWALAAAAFVAGGLLVRQGLLPQKVEEMSMPTETYSVAPDDAAQAAQGDEDTDASQLAAMPASSVYLPALDKIAPVLAQDGFVASNYDDLQSLVVPSDPQKASWFSGGGALWGGDEGTTLVAAHVATDSNRGVFWGISDMQAGDVVWSKDAEGRLQAWVVTQVWYAEHEAFPQDYFLATGERRLVITTCGGRVNSSGYYAQNVFLVATPIDRPEATPYTPVQEEPQSQEGTASPDAGETADAESSPSSSTAGND